MFFTLKQISFWRQLLPVLLPFVLFVLIAGWTANYFNQQSHIAALSRHAERSLDQAANLIRDELSRVTTDVNYLAQASALHRYLQGKDSAAQLAGDWQHFMLLNKYYDQIRLLDVTGMEKVRIDYHNGRPLTIPRQALQNKARRYYFKEAMALPPGQIYASALDLNVENDAIVEPYQPTMRFAIQVTDSRGRGRGLLVVNFSARLLLQHLHQLSMSGQQGVYLINHQGYWLLGQSRNVEWGFMFPSANNPATRINAHYPEVWSGILKQPHGIHIDSEQVIGFQTLGANSTPLANSTRRLLPFHGSDPGSNPGRSAMAS